MTSRAIVNAHFRLDPPADLPPMIGMLNSTAEWLFSYPGRLSTTTSGADRLLELSREDLAERIWKEVAQVAALPKEVPPWQIVRASSSRDNSSSRSAPLVVVESRPG